MADTHDNCITTSPGQVEQLTAKLEAAKNLEELMRCTTETSFITDLVSLRIGYGEVIPRWKRGSILTANVNFASFPSSHTYLKAREALKDALNDWNALDIGVSLRLVGDLKPAVFQLVYRQDSGLGDANTYASAFCPGTSPNYRKLFVFAKAFEPHNIDFMANIFRHEIGHILGLRHEHANKTQIEKRIKSVQFGPDNPSSVMNYFDHLRMFKIHSVDIVWIRKFYDYDKPEYCGIPINDVEAKCLLVRRRSTV